MIKIDTRGELCPLPLIKTKKAIASSADGETLEVLTDNDTARDNLLDYITELGFKPACATDSGVHTIVFSLDGHAVDLSVDPVCPVPTITKQGFTLVLKSSLMGEGDPTLGAMLMRAYINSLSELDVKPTTIIIYNSGVSLAVEGSDTSLSLKKLADEGIEIIVCGTCADFYELKDKLAVGKISNMYKISSLLSEASKIVVP